MPTNNPAPIAIVAYNRPWHLQQTIEALSKNEEASKSELFVFSDAPQNDTQNDAVMQVRDYLKTVTGFKSIQVIERQENFGLARSVIGAVEYVLTQFDRIIVLEDDLVTSRYFLQYMNAALELYADEPNVASIHGFFYDLGRVLPDTFFLRGTDCLGWATWKRAWHFFEPDGKILLKKLEDQKLGYAFDFDGSYSYSRMLKNQVAGKTSSWAIRWYAAAYLRNMVTLNPGISHIVHIGNDSSGTNFGNEKFLDTTLAVVPTPLSRIATAEDTTVRQYLVDFYRKTFIKEGNIFRFFHRIKMRLKKLMGTC